MADILQHPLKGFMDKAEEFPFPDGSMVTLTPAPGCPLDVKTAIYLLEDVKMQILIMMRE